MDATIARVQSVRHDSPRVPPRGRRCRCGAQPTTQAYRDDIAALCDVLRLSGADQQEPSARAALIAMWLGPHLKTPESHDFLVKIQPLVGTAKADALDGEAKRLGMPGCALAAEWRK